MDEQQRITEHTAPCYNGFGQTLSNGLAGNHCAPKTQRVEGVANQFPEDTMKKQSHFATLTLEGSALKGSSSDTLLLLLSVRRASRGLGLLSGRGLALARDEPLEGRHLLFSLPEPFKDSVDCITKETRWQEWGVHQEAFVFFFYALEVQPYVSP